MVSISSLEKSTKTNKAEASEIRPCRKADIAPIAEIHRSQSLVPGSLLAHASLKLIAALYEEFLDGSVFLAHTSNDVLDGFILGGPEEAMLRCRLAFLKKRSVLCIADYMRKPHLWLRILRSSGMLLGRMVSSKTGAERSANFRLVSLAVAPDAIRKGIGTALVDAFEKTIRGNCSVYCLNVLKTNTSAIRFYEHLGFHCAGETAIARIMRKEMD